MMRKPFIALIMGVVLPFPLYAQEQGDGEEQTAPEVVTLEDMETQDAIDITPSPYFPEGSLDVQPGEEQAGVMELCENGEDCRDRGGIEQDTLDPLDPAAIGLLYPGDGGVEANFWQGSDRATLARLLPVLPSHANSPTVRNVARRILLSSTAIPAANARGEQPTDILETRLQKLVTAGRLDDLINLLSILPNEMSSPFIRDIRVRALLLGGELAEACNLAATARREEGAARWLEILTVCEAIEANRTAVDLQLSLLRDANSLSPAFEDLVREVLAQAEGLGGSGQLLADMNANDLTPVMIAVLDVLGMPFPVIDAKSLNPLVLAALATQGEMGPLARAELMRVAAARGIIDPAILPRLYDDLELDDGLMRAAVDIARQSGLGFDVEAALYQIARAAGPNDIRVEALQTLWRQSLLEGSQSALADVMADALAALPINDTTVSLGHDAIRIALYAGRSELAQDWYAGLRRLARQGEASAAAAVDAAWPLMLVDSDWVRYDFRSLRDWTGQLPDKAEGGVALVLNLLQSIGYEIDDRHWTLTDQDEASNVGTAPSILYWRQYLMAEKATRNGEALVIALAGTGGASAGQIHPAGLSLLVHSLAQNAMEREARAITVEALIERGF